MGDIARPPPHAAFSFANTQPCASPLNPCVVCGVCRLLVVWEDERVAMGQQGVTVWIRDEAMAGKNTHDIRL